MFLCPYILLLFHFLYVKRAHNYAMTNSSYNLHFFICPFYVLVHPFPVQPNSLFFCYIPYHCTVFCYAFYEVLQIDPYYCFFPNTFIPKCRVQLPICLLLLGNYLSNFSLTHLFLTRLSNRYTMLCLSLSFGRELNLLYFDVPPTTQQVLKICINLKHIIRLMQKYEIYHWIW